MNKDEYPIEEELVKFMQLSNKLLQENKQLKERINKAINILGKYKHYSSPNEKQNSDNEDIVNDAYEVLKGEENENKTSDSNK